MVISLVEGDQRTGRRIAPLADCRMQDAGALERRYAEPVKVGQPTIRDGLREGVEIHRLYFLARGSIP